MQLLGIRIYLCTSVQGPFPIYIPMGFGHSLQFTHCYSFWMVVTSGLQSCIPCPRVPQMLIPNWLIYAILPFLFLQVIHSNKAIKTNTFAVISVSASELAPFSTPASTFFSFFFFCLPCLLRGQLLCHPPQAHLGWSMGRHSTEWYMLWTFMSHSRSTAVVLSMLWSVATLRKEILKDEILPYTKQFCNLYHLPEDKPFFFSPISMRVRFNVRFVLCNSEHGMQFGGHAELQLWKREYALEHGWSGM